MYAVLGCGSVGTAVARSLIEMGAEVSLFDKDSKRVEALKEEGLDAHEGDLTGVDLKEHGLEEVSAILIMGGKDEDNLRGVANIKRQNPQLFVITRARDKFTAARLKEAGADYVVHTSEVIKTAVIKELDNYEWSRRAETLRNIISKSGEGGVGIFLHDNPDPDALASALALQHICEVIGVKSEIYYSGGITHQENKTFVNLLEVRLKHLHKGEEALNAINSHGKIAFLDMALPSVNNVIPKDVLPNIVIDHHSYESGAVKGDYVDVRPNTGSTSTILTGYLRELNIQVDKRLSTALLYGIRTDTKGLTRSTTSSDMNAATFLNALADKELLAQLESPPMSSETMDIMGNAILNRDIYGSILITSAGAISERDALPQTAEFLLSLEGINTVLVYGIMDDRIEISARSSDIRINLGDILKKAFGDMGGSAGGHLTMGGANLPLGLMGEVEDKDTLLSLADSVIKKAFLKAMGYTEKDNKKKANGNGKKRKNGGEAKFSSSEEE